MAVRSHDLVAEYIRRMRAMTLDDARELMALGLPIRAITTVCPAPCSIRFTDAACLLYEPDCTGELAYIFPATTVDPEWPEQLEDIEPREVVSAGAVVDLVACHPQSPRHALRAGQALTLGAIDLQSWHPDPVRVHRTVNAWLRAGCTGIVLLTRDPYEASRVLREIHTIEAEDRQHARELKRLLRTPPPIHTQITIRPVDRQ
jgi:hypothetical protein